MGTISGGTMRVAMPHAATRFQLRVVGRASLSAPFSSALLKCMPSFAQEHSRNEQRGEWIGPPPQPGVDEQTQKCHCRQASAHSGQHAIAAQRSTLHMRGETDFSVGERRKHANGKDGDTHSHG